MKYQNVINNIYNEVKPLLSEGYVASYIPALSQVPKNKLGIAIYTISGETYTVGDANELFSIQSISKVFTLAMIMDRVGDDLWRRVGREPSGNPFNSLVQLEHENGIPRNPFINAGAFIVTDFLISEYNEPFESLLQFIRKCADNKYIKYNIDVAISEKNYGFRNAALANFLKSYKNLNNNVELVLDTYFKQCSIEMSCIDLARSFLFLANRGTDPITGEQITGLRQTKRLGALLLTCGLYDESGEFAYRVGMPSKSGVGGGIVGFIPGELAIAVWAPALNNAGNSLVGSKVMELFTTYTAKSIF